MIHLRDIAVNDMEPFVIFAGTCNINTDTRDFEQFFVDLDTFIKYFEGICSHDGMLNAVKTEARNIRKYVETTKKEVDRELAFIYRYFDDMGAYTRFANDEYE